MNVQEIETKVREAVHTVLADVEAHEPAIEAAVAAALGDAGVPPELVTVATSLIASLKSHFTPAAPAAPDPAPEAGDPAMGEPVTADAQ